MKKYTYFFSYNIPGSETKQYGSFSLIAENISQANKMYELLYCDSESDRCIPRLTAPKQKLDVHNITESTTLN